MIETIKIFFLFLHNFIDLHFKYWRSHKFIFFIFLFFIACFILVILDLNINLLNDFYENHFFHHSAFNRTTWNNFLSDITIYIVTLIFILLFLLPLQIKLEYKFIISISFCFLFFLISFVNDPFGNQRNIFYMGMEDFFADFFNIISIISKRDPYFGEFKGSYLPLTYMILYPFSLLDIFSIMTFQQVCNSRMGLMSVFLFTGFSVFLLFMALNKIIKKYSISSALLISLVLSYIFFFSIERGNAIILSAAFAALFICYYDSENKHERFMAIISLALASTLKIYPVLLGFLYFDKKQYKEILSSALITIFLVFIPFLFFKGGFANILQFIINSQQMTNIYNITHPKYPFPRFSITHLIYSVIKVFNFTENTLSFITSITQIINNLLSVISITFSLLIKNKYLKISLLTMAIVFLPINSSMYCGLYLFPMIILFFATQEERSKIFNAFTLVIFIIFLNPYQIVLIDTINYLIINLALLSLWLVLLSYSGRQIITLYKKKLTVKA